MCKGYAVEESKLEQRSKDIRLKGGGPFTEPEKLRISYIPVGSYLQKCARRNICSFKTKENAHIAHQLTFPCVTVFSSRFLPSFQTVVVSAL